jgi:hypothetical protein
MPGDSLTVTWRMAHAPGPEIRAAWDSLMPGFAGEMLRPGCVELVITDQYETVAGQYAVQSPVRANLAETAEDYRALRADGAAAAAKTIDLPDGKIVVVAASALINLGSERAGRALLHEAQHVRLFQDGNEAWGVHRRVNLERPPDVGYDFIWTAETVVDEFRCERAVHETGTDPMDMGSNPADYNAIVRSFEAVRNEYHRTGNLLAVYQAAFSSLQRLAQFLAYGAAHIAVNSEVADEWRSIPSMARLLDIVSDIPGAGSLISDKELTEYCVQAARMLRQALRDNGFDSRADPDNSIYFELLW